MKKDTYSGKARVLDTAGRVEEGRRCSTAAPAEGER